MENQEYIENSAKCALQFLEKYNRQTWGYKAFRAVVDLTLSELAAGKVAERYKYDSVKIAEKIKYPDAEYIRKQLNKLADECISRHGNSFKDFANYYNFAATPVLRYEETNGGQYKRNEYWIDYEIFKQDKKSGKGEKYENIDKSISVNEIVLEKVAAESSFTESNFDNHVWTIKLNIL